MAWIMGLLGKLTKTSNPDSANKIFSERSLMSPHHRRRFEQLQSGLTDFERKYPFRIRVIETKQWHSYLKLDETISSYPDDGVLSPMAECPGDICGSHPMKHYELIRSYLDSHLPDYLKDMLNNEMHLLRTDFDYITKGHKDVTERYGMMQQNTGISNSSRLQTGFTATALAVEDNICHLINSQLFGLNLYGNHLKKRIVEKLNETNPDMAVHLVNAFMDDENMAIARDIRNTSLHRIPAQEREVVGYDDDGPKISYISYECNGIQRKGDVFEFYFPMYKHLVKSTRKAIKLLAGK